jgi:hypothetical protein
MPSPDDAARALPGIPEAREVVLRDTGHMLRFTHPVSYAEVIRDFLHEITPRWQLPESERPIAEEVYQRTRAVAEHEPLSP